MRRLATIWLGFLIFILPLKFGNSASVNWQSLHPPDLLHVILSPWPLAWVPIMAGIALILAVTANPIDKAWLWKLRYLWLPFAVLLLACGIGFAHSKHYLEAISFGYHMLSAVAFLFAVLIHLRGTPQCRNVIYGCLLAGMLCLSFHAGYQYFHGYDETLAQIQYQAEQNPEFTVPSGIISRLKQKRPAAFFAITNSLAAHFLLVAPLLLALLWNWGRHIDPPRASQIFLVGSSGVVFLFCFYATKSRAAMGGLLLAMIATAMLLAIESRKFRQKYRWVLVGGTALVPIVAVLLYLLIQDGRTFSSLEARIVYWRGAWEMFCSRPLTGVGMGEFFPEFVRIKPPGAETARTAHSVFYHFLSQTGVVGAAGSIFLVISPLLVWRQKVKGELAVVSPLLFSTAFLGVLGWGIHACADFNIHIPATVLLVGVILALAIKHPSSTGDAPGSSRSTRIALIVLAVLCLTSLARIPGDKALATVQTEVETNRAPIGVIFRNLQDEADIRFSPHAWIKLGNRAIHEQRYDIVEEAFAKVGEIDPAFAAGHFKRAKALYYLRRYKEAEMELRLAFYHYPHKQDYMDLWRQLQHAKHKEAR